MRPSGFFRMDCPEAQPYVGSRRDFLLVARVMEVNPSVLCFGQGPQHFGLLVFSRCLVFFAACDQTFISANGSSPAPDLSWKTQRRLSSLSSRPWFFASAFKWNLALGTARCFTPSPPSSPPSLRECNPRPAAEFHRLAFPLSEAGQTGFRNASNVYTPETL